MVCGEKCDTCQSSVCKPLEGLVIFQGSIGESAGGLMSCSGQGVFIVEFACCEKKGGSAMIVAIGAPMVGKPSESKARMDYMMAVDVRVCRGVKVNGFAYVE